MTFTGYIQMQNTLSLKDKLTVLLDGKNSKSYARIVSSAPGICEEVSRTQHLLGTQSVAETLWCILNEAERPLCKCKQNYRLFNTFNLGYKQYCGARCPEKATDHSEKIKKVWKDTDKLAQMIRKKEATCLEKYGATNAATTDAIREKTRLTNLSKYGSETPLQSETIKAKIKKSVHKKYGVEFPFQSRDIQQKAKSTFEKNNPYLSDKMQIARTAFIAKHGVNPFAVDEIKEKIYRQRKEKFGYKHALQSHMSTWVVDVLENKIDFINRLTGLTLSEAGELLGVNPTTIARRAVAYDCKDIFSTATRSKWEFKFKTFLESIGLVEGRDFVQGDRTVLSGKELDFYFPRINTAIELGSVYWHSEISAGRGHSYHFDKWKQCYNKGIDLLQYWDFELASSWNVIESKILYLFKKIPVTIGARCIKEFKLLSIEEEKAFLAKNHLQGFTGDRRKAYGAIYNGKTVGLMAVAIRPTAIEITRYATDINSTYPGLFSKMLKYVLNDLSIFDKDVISFSDNRHSSGAVYKKSGFVLSKESAPSYYYTKDYHNIEHKKKFTKDKIKTKFNVDIDNKTEWQLMQEEGYDRIWDAGKKLWKLSATYLPK